jgi:hypothetical protein
VSYVGCLSCNTNHRNRQCALRNTSVIRQCTDTIAESTVGSVQDPDVSYVGCLSCEWD